jgi:hypothetical protein
MKKLFERFARPIIIASGDISEGMPFESGILRFTLGLEADRKITARETVSGKHLALEEIIAAHPDSCFNFELTGKPMAGPFCSIVKNMQAEERILASSPHRKNLKIIRQLLPQTATSFSPFEIMWIYWLFRSGFLPLVKRFSADALIIPESIGPSYLANDSFISQAADKGIAVFIWSQAGGVKKFLESGATGFAASDRASLEKILQEIL